LKTGKAIAPYLKQGTLIVLESTTSPGTTEDDLRAVLEKGSGGLPPMEHLRAIVEKSNKPKQTVQRQIP